MAFGVSDGTMARYDGQSAQTKLNTIQRQGQKMVQEVVNTTAALGVGGGLAWYQGYSGGQMMKIGPVSLDLGLGLAAKAFGIYSEMAETKPLKYSEIDWGQAISRAGDGALVWYLGNYLLGVGKKSYDEGVAAGTRTPVAVVTPVGSGVVTEGWNHFMGQGQQVDMPQQAYAGYYR